MRLVHVHPLGDVLFYELFQFAFQIQVGIVPYHEGCQLTGEFAEECHVSLSSLVEHADGVALSAALSVVPFHLAYIGDVARVAYDVVGDVYSHVLYEA